MFLKQVEIVGFKSFATRTVAELRPGIVVVVGPNGSGKSNIADAIRWVLGEQSAKAVRARKSEEVIFAGSASRQPLGMAEVSLVLDNADHTLPLAFEEVRVTRRLYRSGDSEYLLNNARVRLRDVVDHLLQARLGPDSYSVIGQGSVDELILQRPEERRIAFESAADIRRHGLRLHDLRARLSATDANLLRVRDVVAELEPHVRRLKVQADRASRADRVRDELDRVSLAYYRVRLRTVRSEAAAAERALAAASEAVEAAAAASARAEAHLEGLEARAASVDERLAQVRPALESLRSQVRDAERALAGAREQAAANTERRTRLEQDAGDQHERATALRTELAGLQRALAQSAGVEAPEGLTRLQAEAGAAERRAEAARAATQDLRTARDAAERRILAAEADLARAEQRLRQIEAAHAVDASRTEARRARAAELQATLDRLRAEATAVSDRLAVPRAEIGALDAARRAAEARLVAARERLREAAQRHAHVLGALSAIGADLSEAPAGLDAALREALDGLPHLGSATDVARKVRPFDGLLRALLARTVVVESDEAARTAAQRLRERISPEQPAWAVLSLEGLFLTASEGRRVGAGTGEGAALADWRRRLHDLEAEAAQAATARRAAEAEQGEAIRLLDVAEHEATAVRTAVRDLEADLQALRRAENGARVELQQVASLVERAEREPRGAQGERERLQATVREATTALESGRAERTTLAERLRQAEEAAAREGAAVEALRTRMAQAESTLRQREVARAGEEALARRVRTDLQSVERALDETARRIASSDASALESTVAIDRLIATHAAAEQALAPLEQEVADLEARRLAAGQERRAAEASLAEPRAAERALREQREAVHVRAQRAQDERERVDREVTEAADGEDRPPSWVEQLALDLGAPGAREDDAPDPEALRRRMQTLQRDLRALGGAAASVLDEYREMSDRHTFLVQQAADLRTAMAELRAAAEELEGHMRERFSSVFDAVNEAFRQCFATLFSGGEARLVLTTPDDLLGTGIDIVARPPGKKLQGLLSLSGGERALTIVALLFGLLKVNPTPFCVLDEVDAALDESNVQRFATLLGEFSRQIQFVVVTHNRATMEMADAMYGVTMDAQGVSKVLAVQPREVARTAP